MSGRGGRAKTFFADPKRLTELEDLCALQCTQAEIAAFFRVGIATVERWAAIREYRDLMDRGRDRGLVSLRRAQFQAALAGNPAMLIWLGKQLLGQKDQVLSEHTGSIGVYDDSARRQLLAKLQRFDVATVPEPEGPRLLPN